MYKKKILILAAIIIFIIGFSLICYLIFCSNDKAGKSEKNKAPILNEQDRKRLEKEEARRKMIEKLNKEKETGEMLTPDQKAIMRQRMLSEIESPVQDGKTELSPEEKEAARREMIEKLNSLKTE